MSEPAKPQRASVDPAVVARGVWMNTYILAIVFGLACALGLLLVTYASIALTGAEAGQYLNLLSVFMPGYSATAGGAWAGFFWTALYAGVAGGFVYQMYARAAGLDSSKNVAFDPAAAQSNMRLIMRLSPRALGLSMGAIAAAQIFLSTLWLVVRGTAAESGHAALLVHYLPGYSVSLLGALIGAFWLFTYTFGLSWLFATAYNAVVRWKARTPKR